MLSNQQHAAIKAVRDWINTREQPVFRLFGYAGTGETTIARELSGEIDGVLFAAYTGKAASVMRDKGCDGATITARKAQGSQWDNVVLCNEAFVAREDPRKWLYIGLTRAAKKITGAAFVSH